MNCNTTHYRANSSSVPGDPTQSAQSALLASAGGSNNVSVAAGKAIVGARDSGVNVQIAGARPANAGTYIPPSDNSATTAAIAAAEIAAGNVPSRSPGTTAGDTYVASTVSSGGSNGRAVRVNVADAGPTSDDDDEPVLASIGDNRLPDPRRPDKSTVWTTLTKESTPAAIRLARGELVESLFRRAMNGEQAVTGGAARAFKSSAYRAPDMERVGSVLTKTLLGRDVATKGAASSPDKGGNGRGKSNFGSWVGKKPVAKLY